MPGKSVAHAPTEKVGLRIPLGLYREMMTIVDSANLWSDPPRQNFILEAIKEKIERWSSQHSFGVPASREALGTFAPSSGMKDPRKPTGRRASR
jgi:hypothetical protein